MRIRRSLRAASIVAVFGLLLSGCSAGSGGDGGEEGEVTLRLMLPAGAATRSFEPMLADFMAETGIKVEYGSYENAEMRQQQILDLSSGSGSLDVIMLQHSWLPEMATNLVPLDTYFDDDGGIEWDDFLPSMQTLSMVDGVPLMAPVRSFGETLFYRTDLLTEAGFDAPPKTTDEFME